MPVPSKDNKKQTCYFTCQDSSTGETIIKNLFKKYEDLYEYSIYEDGPTFFFAVNFNKRHRINEFNSFFENAILEHNTVIVREKPSKKELKLWQKSKKIKTIKIEEKALSKSQKEKELLNQNSKLVEENSKLLEENSKNLQKIQELEELFRENTLSIDTKKTIEQSKKTKQDNERSDIIGETYNNERQVSNLETSSNLGKRPYQSPQDYIETENNEFVLSFKKIKPSSTSTFVIFEESNRRTFITADNYVELRNSIFSYY